MTKAGELNKGSFLNWKGDPVVVSDKEFFNPGRGHAVVRLKLKNLKSGRVIKETLITDEKVEEIEVTHQRFQFLYFDGLQAIFMDPKSFEQTLVERKIIEEEEKYLKAGEDYGLLFWENRVIGISLPKKTVFKVKETEKGVRGDTVSAATKPATLDNGLIVKVPLFIKIGEEVIISTETGEYLSRKNQKKF
ncbi:elongation factor P [Candidatus Shapirobacteria bacterium]|nr:elongation factor P [Candidatus Shapirobacteria bacterium]